MPDARFSPLPFLIQWDLAPDRFPGARRVEQPSGAHRFSSIVLSDPDPDAVAPVLRTLLADDLDYSVERGRPGVSRLVLETASGSQVID